ncbi:MAG: spore germination protein [Lachnospiraceae bacterium]|nr:spore germination protein [Lachnospiraceae bacterium]
MISKNIDVNKRYLEGLCQDCADVNIREYDLKGFGRCVVVYLETTVDTFKIGDVKEIETMEDAVRILMAGNAVLFCQGNDKAYKISSQGYPNMGVQESQMEKVLRGSQEGFADSVKTNVALVRKRIRTPDLKVAEHQMGQESNTAVSLVYMEGRIPPGLLENITNRIKELHVDGVMDSGMVEHLAVEEWYSPFPRFQTTQRPDRAAMELLKGRILFLSDNSPVGLLLPTTFHNFMEASEDAYNPKEIVTFVKALRYVALVVAMLLGGLYLAVTNFHTQLLPTNLLLSFAEARQGVPFPSLVEVLLMELSFELIREAGIRMPGPLGGTIGIVGGLIIGQAAVTANLVSPMVVVMVALTALGAFAIPNDEFASTFRLLKYVFIFLGAFLGIFGIVLGVFGVLEHLSGLVSFKIPFLMPFVSKEYKNVCR